MSRDLISFVMEGNDRQTSGSIPSLPLSEAAREPPKHSGELLLAALSYFSVLGVLPLLLAQRSVFCRFHGKQGITYNIVYFLVHGIAGGFAWALPDLAHLPFLIVTFHICIVTVAIIRTLLGHYFTFPFIASIAEEIPF